MRIRHRINFDYRESDLLGMVEKASHPYKRVANIISLDVEETDPLWAVLKPCLTEARLSDSPETLYSAKEIREADWAVVRSDWHWGYPMPDRDFSYLSQTYDDTYYCPRCGAGLIQKGPFRVKKEPKWGRRSFLQLNWIYDELFAYPKTAEAMLAADISGIAHKQHPLLCYKSGEALEDIVQMSIPGKLPPGLVPSDNIRELVCDDPGCGAQKILYDNRGPLRFESSIFEGAPDVVKTAELFGGDTAIAARLILVSNRFIRFYLENKLRGLIIEPIELP